MYRQKQIHEQRGLSLDFCSVRFLTIDQTKEGLGLEDDAYWNLLASTTHIIHNAWPVNFNLSLSAFEPQFEGCLRLVRLANSATYDTSIVFVSSVGTANSWSENFEGNVPEELLVDPSVPESMGYAQAKHVAERLFAAASTHLGLNTSSCRVGQIAGPVNFTKGQWNPQEWFPSLLLSSAKLGIVPDSLAAMDRMDWISVNVLGDIIVELLSDRAAKKLVEKMTHLDSSLEDASEVKEQLLLQSTRTCTHQANRSARFLHLVNPHGVPWSNIVKSIAVELHQSLSFVSYSEWLTRIRALNDDREDRAGGATPDLQALKLLDFYTDIGNSKTKRPVFSTSLAEACSPRLRNLPPVSEEWVKRGIHQLRSCK